MVIPSAGSVVLVPFPFSDLTQSKLRPTVVLASGDRSDWILCQITSKPYGDPRAEPLTGSDFARGGLRVTIYAWPAKLFTAHASLSTAEVGQFHRQAFRRIQDAVLDVLK